MVFVSFLIFLLALGHGAKPEETPLELGSGEMESQTSTTPMIYLIDDNGDIATTFRNITDLSENVTSDVNIDLVTEEVDIRAEDKNTNESAILMTEIMDNGGTTEKLSAFSGDSTIVVTTEVVTTMHPTEVSTTEMPTEIDLTTTTPEPTVIPVNFPTELTTIEIGETSSVIIKQTTTTSTKQPTTFSSTTTVAGKSDKSTGHIPNRPEEEDKNVCVFLNPEFQCSSEVICYGEGEIDCDNDDDDIIMDKISLATSEDDHDYDAPDSGSDTIGTFPPNLVGVGTPKKISFYNMKSFTTTDKQMEETSEAAETTPAPMGETSETVMTTIPSEASKVKDCSDGTISEAGIDCSTTPAVTTESSSTVGFTESVKNEDFVSELTEKTTNEESFTSTMHETTDATTFESESMKILFSKLGSTTPKESVDDETTMASSTEAPVDIMEKVRRRRGFFSSNSDLTPEAKKKLSVEYLQRKYLVNPTCRLSGNIQCLPVPTTGTCRGMTFCQAKQRKAETAESSKDNGVKIWIIVVIVICGFFGFMVVGMIIYLSIHSCKKLKVQPTHDVTPLNYITKKAESTETA